MFKTGNPPSVPVLSSPVINLLITNLQPKLDWGNVTVPTGTIFDHYQVQVATAITFSVLVYDQNVTVSDFTPPAPLTPNTKYYWRVRSFNLDGHYSGWSAVRSFREALLAPELTYPVGGTIINTTQPTFTWNPNDVATGYTIQVSRYANFSTLLVNASTASTSYTPGINLPKGVLLYWRVRANGSNGPSLWVQANFKIQ